MRTSRGFTLMEMIIAMVITGILGGIVAVFIAGPVRGYVDTARRAELTDMADLALKRIALEIRTAVPNSVYPTPGDTTQIEFIPAYAGGRYCSETDTCPTANGDLDFGSADAAGNTFDILGPPIPSLAASSQLVVFNTGQCSSTNPSCATASYPALPCDGLNAYEGCNRRSVTTAAGSSLSSLTFDASQPVLTWSSSSRRFQLVPSTGPVKFRCTGGNELRRYTGYGWTHTETGSGALLVAADTVTCNFTYNALSATNGQVTVTLTLTKDGETITLYDQIHVDNMP